MLSRREVRPVAIGIALVGCVIGVPACSAAVNHDDTALLREIGTPPPLPPQLILPGASLPPADWEWLRQDGWDEGADDDGSLWDALSTQSVSNDLRFELDAREPPTELVAVVYRHPADSAAPPDAESGREYTCTPGGSICSTASERGIRGIINLRSAAGSTEMGTDLVIVLHAQWEVATGSEVALDTATYGFKAVMRR